jgi:hypothetical protein
VSQRLGQLRIAGSGQVPGILIFIGGRERGADAVAEHGFYLRFERSADAAQMLAFHFKGCAIVALDSLQGVDPDSGAQHQGIDNQCPVDGCG